MSAKQEGTEARVQYRVQFSKNDEAVSGPDDADAIVRIASKDAGSDPTLAFMQGKLKSEGSTGVLFRVLMTGEAASEINRLASRP